MIEFKRLRHKTHLCLKILPRNRRDPAYRRHDHVCKLEFGHPVRDGSGVQLHECGRRGCTIAWESDPRPPTPTTPNIGANDQRYHDLTRNKAGGTDTPGDPAR